MRFIPWDECDESELIAITQEPMRGKIDFSFGLSRLSPPPDCTDLGGYGIDEQGSLVGCFLYWNWPTGPTGDRYLAGLRLCQNLSVRPTPRLWKAGFELVMDEAPWAWTSIGLDNHQARRILEHNATWLPVYHPCQKITTWFVPLRPGMRSTQVIPEAAWKESLVEGDFRHVAIESGSGFAYHLGRALHRMGLPGIPEPGKRMRIVYANLPDSMPADDAARRLNHLCKSVRGYDGFVIALPNDSDLASKWQQCAPGMSWKWESQLYCVSWKELDQLPPVPQWKAWWL